MTEQEYKEKLQQLAQLYEADKKVLGKKYAFSNNEVKEGDIVRDPVGAILVETIQVYLPYSAPPCCVYIGKVLNKDGTITKKKENIRSIYQCNAHTHEARNI